MNTSSQMSLLVVDDEPDLRTLYELTLLREGYAVETSGSVEEAWGHLSERTYHAIITDMRLPDGTGLDLLRRIEAQGRREKAIVITAFGSSENAVDALKAGAYDYLTKPVDLRQFRAVVASALGRSAMSVPTMVPSSLPSEQAEASAPAAVRLGPWVRPAATPPAAASSLAFSRMVGHSQAIAQVRTMVEKVARSMAPVLIHGESGTGKELVAKSIHEVSTRCTHPFIAVNCSAIPEQLLEAEFFGYRKGAFTGANEDREGFFQAANGGTLFLDEIGDLPLSMQSKLLRCIQERAVRPVGATAELSVNVRILSATHKDLASEVQLGRFRQDLYYRLNVIQISVPPLRERFEDLAEISAQILSRLAKDSLMTHVPQLSREALVYLSRHPFPGNVRELENLLHRAVALSSGPDIGARDLGLPELVFTDSAAQELELLISEGHCEPAAAAAAAPLPMLGVASAPAALPSNLEAYLDEVERDILCRALERFRNNRTAAGASLGLSLRQIRYRMARLNIMVGGGGEAPNDADPGPTG